MNLELSINEINYILKVLEERPYKESSTLINKIMMQDKPQSEDTDKKEVKTTK